MFKRFISISEILILIAVFTLVGCATVTEKVVVKTEVKVITTPKTLLLPCTVTEPPDKAEYLSKTYQKKEQALTDYALSLLKDLRICNTQVKQIEEFQTNEVNFIEKNKSK